MDKTPPMPQDSEYEHNRKAELNGVSPRRVKGSPLSGYDNGLGAVHRSPRLASDAALESAAASHSQSQSRVGELGEQHLAQASSSGMLHQGASSPASNTVRQRVSAWGADAPGSDTSSRPRLAANQSPRRAGMGASGPLLRNGGGSTPTAQVQQGHRQETSPRDQDPSTLSFVEKKEMWSGNRAEGARTESAPAVSSRVSGATCRNQQMPAGHTQSQVLNRGGVLRQGQQASQVQQRVSGASATGLAPGMAVQGGHGAGTYGGYPVSRSTIPNTRTGGSAARPSPTMASPAGMLAGSVPARIQQGGHPQSQVGMSQSQVLQAARGRSSSPAYTAGVQGQHAQPYSPARQHYVQYHR